MKATLIALMTLGSLAMAAAPQQLTIIPQVTGVSGGNYDTIVFTLTNDGDRTTVLGGAELTPTVTLDNIQLAGRDKTLATLAGWYPVITDATGLVVGISTTPSTTSVTTHEDDWGLAYTRSWATLSGFEKADLTGTSLTLNLGQEYRLYLGNSEQATEVYSALLGVAKGWTQEPVTISEEYYTAQAIKVTTASGQYDPESSHEYGLMNGGSIVGPTYAPMIGITVQNVNVPEPTTGTLSLLALAGLCIRRRK